MENHDVSTNNFKPNLFQRFFWFCSGIDTNLLIGKEPNYPLPLRAEYNKYIGIGTAVFFTSVFAAISAGFALSFMEGSKWWWCALFGLIWGVNIFFLDRYIVSSMRKSENKWKEILQAAPRILIALVFAFTISVPIELSLFNGKIQDELSKYNTGRVSGCEQVCSEKVSNINNQIGELDRIVQTKQKEQPAGYQQLLAQQKGVQQQISQISNEISKNAAIISNNRFLNPKYPENSGSKYILNNVAIRYQQINQRKNGELAVLRGQYKDLTNEIQTKYKKFQEELDNLILQVEQQKEPLKAELKRVEVQCPIDIAECQKVAKGNNDLLSRYDALESAKGGWFTSIWWASFMLKLLFIFLELAPILSKILAGKGLYDERVESLETLERLELSKINNAVNESLLDIKNENKKNDEARKSDILEDLIKKETKIHEMQQLEELVRQQKLEAFRKKQLEIELQEFLNKSDLEKKLAEAKAIMQINYDSIESGVEAEKELQKKLAEQIAKKQYAHLKAEIDKFFDEHKGANGQEKQSSIVKTIEI